LFLLNPSHFFLFAGLILYAVVVVVFPGTAPAIAVTSTAFEGCFLKHCQGAQNGKTGCMLLFNAVHCNVITLTVRDFFELFDTDCTCWF
jgi:hypothetical protein